MSDYITAVCASQVSSVMSDPAAGFAFLANRRIAQACYEGLRSVDFTAGDLLSREKSSSDFAMRTSAAKERQSEEGKRRLYELAGDLESSGYRISVDEEGTRVKVSW